MPPFATLDDVNELIWISFDFLIAHIVRGSNYRRRRYYRHRQQQRIRILISIWQLPPTAFEVIFINFLIK